LERIPFALKRLDSPIDLRLLRHIVAVGVENCIEVDPVRPGLDPYTSDIFSVQITVAMKGTGQLRTWVFNTAKVPVTDLADIFRLPKRKALYIAHNARFDLKHLILKLGFAPKNTVCTSVGSRMLYLGLQMRHSLKDAAKRCLGYLPGAGGEVR
jgi:ribonuclease D